MLAVKKITKRWLINSFGIILVLVIVMVVAASVSIRNYYYNGVRQYMMGRADSVTERLVSYSQTTGSDFMPQVRRLVEQFEYKNKMELMAVLDEHTILITSSGFQPDAALDMPDYRDALTSTNGIGEYVGTLGTERVMAITCLSGIAAEELSAMRYVTSLTAIDRQIAISVGIACLLAVCIILFVIFSSSYFVNSIIRPLGEINSTTRQIAQGDFAVRLEVDSDDEIGELCRSINEMAEGLSASEQIKNDFISSVSHELRTPLTAIRGWGETLLSDGDIDPQTAHKGVQIIMSEAERLSVMVEELLDFSRLQSGRLKLETERLDAVAELSDAVLMYTQRAKLESKSLIYDEPEFFAPVLGDRNRLRQVFVNILDNALKYSDSGDSVTVTATLVEHCLQVQVSDTGVGIAQEDLSKVKDRFYKGKTTRRGSGIGLAVADEIITMHGGSLTLTSQKGEGTTVTILLPIAEKEGSS
ncbi:MAG: HAMP domain-containing sensor histidine kinase [Angelakisella sp.]